MRWAEHNISFGQMKAKYTVGPDHSPVCAHRAWVDFVKIAPKKSAKAYGFRHIGF